MNDLFAELQNDGRWVAIQKKIRDSRPMVPMYNPTIDNTEDWKHKCALQQGFDLCAQIIGQKF